MPSNKSHEPSKYLRDVAGVPHAAKIKKAASMAPSIACCAAESPKHYVTKNKSGGGGGSWD